MIDRRRFLCGLCGFATFGAVPAWAQQPPRRPQGSGGAPDAMPLTPARGPKILDVHAHFLVTRREDASSAVQPALQVMDRLGIAKTLIMPPPQPPGHPILYDYEAFLPYIRSHSDRFGFLGGGGILNPLIHHKGPTASERVQRDFEVLAERILAAGAVGFGEITAHHVSYFSQHPYESVPADHPLLRLLADIAARRDVPIDLHMDPIPRDMAPPARLTERSNNNPPTLVANIGGFERLLAHNRAAKIVWAHAGRDTLGTWSVALSRGLLQRHSNLFMSLSMHPPFGLVAENSLLGEGGQPNQAWIALIGEYPDRFVVGSDFFHQRAERSGQTLPPPTPPIRRFVNALPSALGLKVAHENASRLYRVTLQ
jgi:predicted TIM-barrel fold metal-dependent hydrolase